LDLHTPVLIWVNDKDDDSNHRYCTVALEDDWTPAEAVGPPAFASVGGSTLHAAASGGVESIWLDRAEARRTPTRN
jgi:hypothetical protein